MVKINRLYQVVILLCIVISANAQTIYVSTASQLQTALNNALPGHVIQIQDGYYERPGGFYASAGIDGTQANPITVIGSRNVVLSTNNLSSGYAFSLKGNKYWIIKGFTVTNSKNGVVLDRCKYVTVDSIQAKKLGQDGIHLRTHTSYSVVKNCYIDSTGLNDYSYGEGIYVGSAYSNWCTYTDCQPDTSNYNQILNNSFGSFITAENIDIKEGTKGGLIKGNVFNGAGLQNMNGGDSWIDMKGNYYIVEDNIGNNSILDGFQTHIRPPGGYGNHNIFRNNTLNVNGPGYGIRVQASSSNGTAPDNIVCSNNTVTGAALGLSNVSQTTCAAVLPVQIIRWNVAVQSEQFRFEWEVASIDEVDRFIIEFSENGRDFVPLHTQKAAGRKYQVQRRKEDVIGNYFRLTVVMKNTQLIYSNIVDLKASSFSDLRFQNNTLLVGFAGEKGSVEIYNSSGQRLRQMQLSRGYHNFHIPGTSGVYLVSVSDERNARNSKLIFKP